MVNPDNVAAGLKATLNNPNVSDEAKEHAVQRLESEFNLVPVQESGHTKDPDKVKQGMKAAIHNPNVSEGKKEELRHKLEDQF